MGRVYSKGSLKLAIKDEHKQDIKDVATQLKQELYDQKIRFPIDVAALVYNFLVECGVEGLVPDNIKEDKRVLVINEEPKYGKLIGKILKLLNKLK